MKQWSSGDSHRRCYTGKLRGYLTTTFRGMRPRDWVGTPRQVVLRFIASYQAHSSAGEARCGRGVGRSCSNLGYRYVDRYGAVQGVLLAVWVVVTCGAYEDPCGGPGRSGGSCCPG